MPIIMSQSLDLAFADAAKRHADHIAVTCDGTELTFEELEARARSLSVYLRLRCSVRRGDRVGIYMARSERLVVATLAVVMAGAAYVPLDMSYPLDRIDYMRNDAQVRVVLCDKPDALQPCRGEDICLVCLDDAYFRTFMPTGSQAQCTCGPDDLAYLMYTSGSTGNPKGVAVPHRSIVSLVTDTNYISIAPGHRIAQVSNSSFDAATFEIWGALLNGATLVVITGADAYEPTRLTHRLKHDRIDAIMLTSAVVSQIALHDASAFSSVSTLLFGGEKIDSRFVETLLASHPPESLRHMYGPTETTTFASAALVKKVDENSQSIPIGFPISNTQIYLLDEDMNELPRGATGELYIGGAGVAHGYLNRAALTAEKFVPDPFGGAPGARLYRTGDLARYLPGGDIEFVGRSDHQVKVRGYRIELGEIESSLREQPGVRDAVVLARAGDDGEKRLVAYVMCDAQVREADSHKLRDALREVLPPYMVPSAFVQLEKFPLTPNGKIDRHALPEPESMNWGTSSEDGMPRGATQASVAAIWEKLLKVSAVGIQDDFFALGGHSLLAIRLVAHIQRELGVTFPIDVLFDGPTIEQMAAYIEAQKEVQEYEVARIPRAERDSAIRMSFAQERMWFLEQLSPDTAFYNIPMVLRLRGEVKAEALSGALQDVVDRHEVLRTALMLVNDEPAQVIRDEVPVELRSVDLSGLGEHERELETLRLVREDAARPFDLGHAPLMRTLLMRHGEQEYVLLVNVHHVAFDGWSRGIFVQELTECYRARVEGGQAALAALTTQYADFAQWQRSWLKDEELGRQLTYWKTRLAQAPQILELPSDFKRPQRASHRGATQRLDLPPEVFAQITEVSRQHQVTPFMLVLAAFNVLLYRYAGQGDICVGTPVANRNREEVEGLIGLFVNTLVLRTKVRGDRPFSELLQQVREMTLEAYAHQDLPFELLVEALNPDRRLDANPLVQVMFAYETERVQEVTGGGVNWTFEHPGIGAAKFDLSVFVYEAGGRLTLSAQYATDLFEEARVSELLRTFGEVLRIATSQPRTEVGAIPLAFDEVVNVRQQAKSKRDVFEPRALCVHELFEQQALKTPEAIAVRLGERSWTFAQVDASAEQLALRLIEAGVESNDLVAIHLEQSLAVVVSQLAILKAGAAFLPFDMKHPPARIRGMLEDARPRVVVMKAGGRSMPEGYEGKVIWIDELGTADTLGLPVKTSVARRVSPDQAAYCIYTSGSTGQPKGVLVPHRSAINLADTLATTFGRGGTSWEGARVGSLASLAFDASIRQLLLIALGATHCIFPDRVREDLQQLAAYIDCYGIEVMNFTPTLFKAYLEAQRFNDSTVPWPRTLLIGGEQFDQTLWDLCASREQTSTFNSYGPTETTIFCSVGTVKSTDAVPHIGFPISNTQIYLLDEDMNELPRGATGELYIGGAGVAHGYLNRAALTAEKFVPDPFGGAPGARLYRTGDLARYLPGGDIELVGRSDHQVKVRGYRIELGEIESSLREQPGVRDAVVLARAGDDGEKRLVAYVMCDAQVREADSHKLRDALREVLPPYMVPSAFVQLEKFPLTPNGKIDRHALPEPESMNWGTSSEDGMPRGATQASVAAIWEKLLKVSAVGIQDDFFALGGHSLLAIRLVAHIQRELGVTFPIDVLFDGPTIEQMAAYIEAQKEVQEYEVARIPRAERDSAIRMSFAQERMWFLEQLSPDTAFYNIPMVLRLRGEVKAEALSGALQDVVDRHEVLRTALMLVNDEPAQVIRDEVPVELRSVDLSGLGNTSVSWRRCGW
ncbi:amino acid adenylation domain-containing protein [Burkholderia sp. MBR-1]|nr:amino acid adenylation domain-containing protein [Burkholderia sp. MBR-1]